MNNCDLIRDLMPLYADCQASEASRKAIEEHTAQCPACQKLLQEMCTPLEPDPEDRTREVMDKLYRRQRRKKIQSVLLVIAAVLLILWGFLEITNNSQVLYAASTNEEKILKEMPALALTDGELALADTILEIPEIQDFFQNSGEESLTLNLNSVGPYLEAIRSENGKITEAFIWGCHIYITVIDGNQYTCLTYSDVDQTGHIDQITKTYAIYPKGIVDENGFLGETDTVYELFYAIGGMTKCQKFKSRHMWFSFLDT